MNRLARIAVLVVVAGAWAACSSGPSGRKGLQTRNDPDRAEWFQDLGVGMFIHWSFDSQLGLVISHSMVGASGDYLDRYIHELPRTFNPKKFAPEEWARLAKLAGMKYVVFTTKHHNGFCMFETKTTDFNVMNTPCGQDVTRKIVEAFRRQGIAVGFYFSPDDFRLLQKLGIQLQREVPSVLPTNVPALMELNKAQMAELMTGYGPVDVVFLDGQPDGLKELAWELQPKTVVTRGEMKTPEQEIPGSPMPGPWEACFTLGTQWQFKPTNEEYKSGTKLIEMVIETRSKGGNLLINVGPQPDGEIPFEQDRRLRELGLWLFVNHEAVYNVRPWHVTNEGNIWFTRAKDKDTVYAFVTGTPWEYGKLNTVILRSVQATEGTEVEILGQSGAVLEYKPGINPSARWKQEEDGLRIIAMHAQRLYNDRKWPNPMVLRITHAQPARR
jgi:alpha-L-fucosidase